ncbi:DUF1127 domain-containing protein [Undibacterium rugosum]|uniref:DUF1127 domain-containing protein n=1 Tax=Undibacterium rugosum TaxID=2762291 RepID=A0A923KZA7_9BURK|nr:DUF1127 domain-containing protein [Undibacterium rugosum]MBC3935718.1 DUF1127 domain-containing protein [Undibacterium rugosum]MBR7778519.1 DUF1127 domain-containing protein [Undibacterium rugosum]
MASQNRIVALIKFCGAWLRQRRIARGQDALELRGMEDRELLDLGIGRSEIPGLLQQETPEDAVRLQSIRSTAVSLSPVSSEMRGDARRRSV